MTDHTPTPEPVCGARHLDAVNAALVCELPPGHGAHHRAQTTPGEYFNWPDEPEAAPEPVASGQPDVGVSWRSIAGRAEAALDAHRVAMAKALALATSTPWDAITDQARQVTADRDSAEEATRRAMEQRQEMAAERYAWQERGDRAERRAEQAEAALNRVRSIAKRLTAQALAFQDVLDDSDRDPWARTIRAELDALAAALDGEQPDAGSVPEPPCFHPSWETEPTVGARRCTDCGEWLDPQPAPAKPDGAALWAVIRDHAFNDTQWWRKVNRRRDHAQLNTYVQRGPGHTSTR